VGDITEHYQIAGGSGISGLEEKVNKLMAEGWIPVGGILVEFSPIGNNFYRQAMVKA